MGVKGKGKTAPKATITKTAPKATTPTTLAVSTRERVDNAPRCYKYGGLRHYARDCPNLKTLAFVPDDASLINDTDAKPKLDEPGDELVYPNRGEALVIQRVLYVAISKSIDDNSWLCINISRTKCTSKGKICDMIIDGGSCENIVSTYMVEKLGMKIEDNPELYQLTWLKNGTLLKSVNVVLCNFLLEEMVADLRYFNSLESEVDSLRSQLETQKTQLSNEINRLSREYYYADHMNAILGVYTKLDEVTNLQCDYLELLQKCKCLETELS
nr:reverse transcriptase domain-containing protein [Tanacetum cinerariifolium]